MRSLRSVIKGASTVSSEEIIEIPDTPRRRPLLAGENPSAEAAAAQAYDEEMYGQALERAQLEGEGMKQKLMSLAHEEREALLAQAQQDAVQIKEDAKQAGYQAGLQQRKGELDRVLQEFNRLTAELKVGQQEFLETYLAELQSFSIEIASKILLHQVSIDETSMAALVKSAVGSVKDVDWLTIKLPEQMPGLLEQLRRDFPPGARIDGRRVELAESDLPMGGCLLETPVGSIDVSIQAQLERLRTFFEKK